MAVTFTVQADSKAEVEAALRELCEALGCVPLGRLSDLPGRTRWMARARPVGPSPREDTAKAPHP